MDALMPDAQVWVTGAGRKRVVEAFGKISSGVGVEEDGGIDAAQQGALAIVVSSSAGIPPAVPTGCKPGWCMDRLRFVVVGTGRCGTGYIAALLTALGVPCGHERVFTPIGVRASSDLAGDASWMAVPHLATFDGAVLHQTRQPMDVIRSLVGIGLLSDPAHGAYREFAHRHAALSGRDDEIAAAAAFCLEWNRRCEVHAHLRYRVEDLDVELPSVLEAVGERPDPEDVRQALELVDRRLNHRRRASIDLDDISPPTLRAEVAAMTDQYGYGGEPARPAASTLSRWQGERGS